MVERFQDTMNRAVFVDLDGTLLKGNSMKIFMRRLPMLLMRHHSPGAMILSLWWMGLRCFRLISHRRMKWCLTRIARRRLNMQDWDDFASELVGSLSNGVRDFVESQQECGCMIYMATAALEEYSVPLGRLLGYNGVIATQFTREYNLYMETRGSLKRDRIKSVLKITNTRMEWFLTDHSDDLSTATDFPKVTMLVNPSSESKRRFREIGVTNYL